MYNKRQEEVTAHAHLEKWGKISLCADLGPKSLAYTLQKSGSHLLHNFHFYHYPVSNLLGCLHSAGVWKHNFSTLNQLGFELGWYITVPQTCVSEYEMAPPNFAILSIFWDPTIIQRVKMVEDLGQRCLCNEGSAAGSPVEISLWYLGMIILNHGNLITQCLHHF